MKAKLVRLFSLAALGVLLVFLPSAKAQVAVAPLPPVETMPATPFVAPAGSWTLVVLPDTQHYVADGGEVFRRQTAWIVAHRKSHHIVFVAHEGDVTNDNSAGQWATARGALAELTAAGVPWAILPGNKDLGPGGNAADRTTGMNDFFKPDDYRHSAAFGLFEPGHLENSWHAINTPAGRWLLLAIEFGPRDEVLAWANAIVQAHSAQPVIVVTHAHLYNDGALMGANPQQGGNPRRYPLAQIGSVNEGTAVWEKFLARHANLRLVLNGHVTGSGVARLAGTGLHGNTVWQLLANFQRGVLPDRGYGGGGYLRLLQFQPDGKTVQVRTYSPWYDHWLTDEAQQFTIELAPVISAPAAER